jgi:hypothetical protein
MDLQLKEEVDHESVLYPVLMHHSGPSSQVYAHFEEETPGYSIHELSLQVNAVCFGEASAMDDTRCHRTSYTQWMHNVNP